MTHVLLIADTERLQRVFAALEIQGVLQLRTAATLTQGDQEISASAPAFTFVQSRISGFSGIILLRHLKKTLPKQAKVVLLAGDAEDAEQARQDAIPFLDLTLDDEALADAVRQVVQGKGHPARKKGAASKPAGAGKGRPAKGAKPAPLASSDLALPAASAGAEPGKTKEPAAPEEVPGSPLPEAKEPVQELPGAPEMSGAPPVPQKLEPLAEAAAELPAAEEEEQPAAEMPSPEVTPPATTKAASPSFEEIMRRASAQSSAAPPGPSEVEDRVYLGKQVQEPVETAEEAGFGLKEAGGPLPEESYRGESLEEAMLRAQKKKHRSWLIPLAVALVFIPLLVFYLVGRNGSEPAPTTAQVPAPVPGPAPTTALPPSSAAKPAPKAGLKTLPPVLEGLKLDPDYGKTHPGWVRYLGASAEYKLFRESDLYRAMQVIALPGQTIPDQLFKRVLLEFGGSDSYRVESTGKKDDYALEHGTVQGEVALTIYRRKSDLQMKGFVVYYR